MSASQTTARILVAEDDTALRELLVELLVDAGYNVVAVASGADALPRLRGTTPPDVVLTDLMMPGMGGEALLAAVQRDFAHIPVIVMTAFGSIDSAVQLVRAGAFDYVTKPVATSALLQSLQHGVIESRERKAQSAHAGSTTTAEPVHEFTGIVAASAQMRRTARGCGARGDCAASGVADR